MLEAGRTDTSENEVKNICPCLCYIVMCSSHVISPKQHCIASLFLLLFDSNDNNRYFVSDKFLGFLGLGSVIGPLPSSNISRLLEMF